MAEKRDLVADMVEAELRAEQERANQRPTTPPKETFARVVIGEEAAIPEPSPASKKERPRRIVEEVAAKHDPRREDSEPPPEPSSKDPHRAVTKPPPPGYGTGQTE